jgi:hypothetical protein
MFSVFEGVKMLSTIRLPQTVPFWAVLAILAGIVLIGIVIFILTARNRKNRKK